MSYTVHIHGNYTLSCVCVSQGNLLQRLEGTADDSALRLLLPGLRSEEMRAHLLVHLQQYLRRWVRWKQTKNRFLSSLGGNYFHLLVFVLPRKLYTFSCCCRCCAFLSGSDSAFETTPSFFFLFPPFSFHLVFDCSLIALRWKQTRRVETRRLCKARSESNQELFDVFHYKFFYIFTTDRIDVGCALFMSCVVHFRTHPETAQKPHQSTEKERKKKKQFLFFFAYIRSL